MKRLPVDATTCTVNGSHFKASSPVWGGLKMEDAEPRVQSTLMLAVCGQEDAPVDIHLDVPFCHPADRTGDDAADFDCRYRVRPKMEPGKNWKGKKVGHVAFERWCGKWWLVVG